MTYPKLCKDCKDSKPEVGFEWNLRCHNPVVNAKDSWALSSVNSNGSNCRDIRKKWWPSACGMRGALWKQKDEVPK